MAAVDVPVKSPMSGPRSAVLIVSACVLSVMGCRSGESQEPPSNDTVAMYRAQTDWTSPGEHATMYAHLPCSERRLCELIKRQLIHPFELHKFATEVGEKWRFEDLEFPTVSSMLDGLAERGEPELSTARSPEDRLVVACWHHALLLASMLRHQRVPVRLRAGFARYIGRGSGLHVGHVICEVWDEKGLRWFLVDPDREKVDFSRRAFEFAPEAWESLRDGADVSGYRSAHYEDAAAIVHLLSVDMRCVLGREVPYWHDPEIVQASAKGLSPLREEQLGVLDRVASCLRQPDTSLQELAAIQSSNAFLKEVDRSEELRRALP
jgi:hypothetical protein